MSVILKGDALSMLKTLPSDSVQVIVTSPPYRSLRRYDIPDIVFDGDPACVHEWGDAIQINATNHTGKERWQHTRNGRDEEQPPEKRVAWLRTPVGQGAFCQQCGAWRGQLGQEPQPDLFIRHMVEIFREARRVLRADGTCWLNMGDCYASSPPGNKTGGWEKWKTSGLAGVKEDSCYLTTLDSSVSQKRNTVVGDLKPKDLVGIPWMLAFALRADGWYLRSEIVWAKGMSFCPSYAGSVMPESVTDRPTRSHEQVFLLTKNERYFYDAEAVKERGRIPAGTQGAKGSGTREGNRRGGKNHAKADGFADVREEQGYHTYDGKRNLRTVWAIGVEPFNEAHFATFPPALVDPCLRAGTSAKGACAACGAPWKRVVEYEPMPDEVKAQFEAARHRTAEDHGRDDGFTTHKPNYTRKRLGERWEPTCDCGRPDVQPCVVLDLFAGSGTVGVACERLQLKFIGIDLGYHEMSERRIAAVAPLFAAAEAP